MDSNIITYESVEERLKNKPVSEWTDQDVFDRYVAYGDDKELDEPIIKEILNLKNMPKGKYIVRKGKINKIKKTI